MTAGVSVVAVCHIEGTKEVFSRAVACEPSEPSAPTTTKPSPQTHTPWSTHPPAPFYLDSCFWVIRHIIIREAVNAQVQATVNPKHVCAAAGQMGNVCRHSRQYNVITITGQPVALPVCFEVETPLQQRRSSARESPLSLFLATRPPHKMTPLTPPPTTHTHSPPHTQHTRCPPNTHNTAPHAHTPAYLCLHCCPHSRHARATAVTQHHAADLRRFDGLCMCAGGVVKNRRRSALHALPAAWSLVVANWAPQAKSQQLTKVSPATEV